METRTNLRKFAPLAGAALLSTGAMAAPIADAPVTQLGNREIQRRQHATPQGAAAL